MLPSREPNGNNDGAKRESWSSSLFFATLSFFNHSEWRCGDERWCGGGEEGAEALWRASDGLKQSDRGKRRMVLNASRTFVGSQHRNGTPRSSKGISWRFGLRALCRCFFLEFGASKASNFSRTGLFAGDLFDGDYGDEVRGVSEGVLAFFLQY